MTTNSTTASASQPSLAALVSLPSSTSARLGGARSGAGADAGASVGSAAEKIQRHPLGVRGPSRSAMRKTRTRARGLGANLGLLDDCVFKSSANERYKPLRMSTGLSTTVSESRSLLCTGLRQLTSALAVNDTLKSLDLSGNEIG